VSCIQRRTRNGICVIRVLERRRAAFHPHVENRCPARRRRHTEVFRNAASHAPVKTLVQPISRGISDRSVPTRAGRKHRGRNLPRLRGSGLRPQAQHRRRHERRRVKQGGAPLRDRRSYDRWFHRDRESGIVHNGPLDSRHSQELRLVTSVCLPSRKSDDKAPCRLHKPKRSQRFQGRLHPPPRAPQPRSTRRRRRHPPHPPRPPQRRRLVRFSQYRR